MNKIVRMIRGVIKVLMLMRLIGGGYLYIVNIGINFNFERVGIMV